MFLLNRDFSLRGLMEIPKARWTKEGWKTDAATEVERIGGRDNHAARKQNKPAYF